MTNLVTRDKPRIRRFEGKVAIVTGVTNGIGRAAAVRLVAEGALVAVNIRPAHDPSTMQGETKEAGGERFPVGADMSEPQQIVDMVQEVARQGGHIDYLVSNAAIKPFMSWNETFLRAVGPVLQHEPTRFLDRDHRGGQADHLRGSRRCHRLHQPPDRLLRYQSNSMPAKALGSVLRTHGIRLGCVEPGAALTYMSAPMKDERDILKYSIDPIAVHRIGDPSDRAGCLAFRLGKDASYVTSTTTRSPTRTSP
jgi:NAD(P)-dependent dehydrogenase (short-subunit alcohol dehydrogenase family)